MSYERILHRYSFFNGIHPENVFFQGVACQLILMELERLGFDAKFVTCDSATHEDSEQWDGIKFRYFEGSAYYLPIITWKESVEQSEAK
jgi:protein arginine N-methyltransferase 2